MCNDDGPVVISSPRRHHAVEDLSSIPCNAPTSRIKIPALDFATQASAYPVIGDYLPPHPRVPALPPRGPALL